WPVIVAGGVGRNPQALPPLLGLSELLGAPVIDAEGRHAFSSTHPPNLNTPRDEAMREGEVVLGLGVSSLRLAARPVGSRAGQFRSGGEPVDENHSHHLARSRAAKLGERCDVAFAGPCADRRGYLGGAAAIDRTGAQSPRRRHAENKKPAGQSRS